MLKRNSLTRFLTPYFLVKKASPMALYEQAETISQNVSISQKYSRHSCIRVVFDCMYSLGVGDVIDFA